MSVPLEQGLRKGESLINILPKKKLRIENIHSIGDGKTQFVVPDVTELEGFKKDVLRYIRLEPEIADYMRGSVITPLKFLDTLRPHNKIGNADDALTLLSNGAGSEEVPLFSFPEENGRFCLNVFHGSTNEHSINISKLANERERNADGSFNNEELRAEYQREVATILRPVFTYPGNDTDKKTDIYLVDDCIATADTMVAVQKLLADKGRLKSGQHVQIDVAVATVQGILLLREFAKQNDIDLEINAGYLAYGLSEGVERFVDNSKTEFIYAHANYIVYPDAINEFKSLSFEQVVADMGNGVKSMPNSYDISHPWNEYRGIGTDEHGKHSRQGGKLESRRSEDKPLLFIFPNGGYGIHAMFKWIREQNRITTDVRDDYSVWVVRASRVMSHDPDFGFGVAFRAPYPDELTDEHSDDIS